MRDQVKETDEGYNRRTSVASPKDTFSKSHKCLNCQKVARAGQCFDAVLRMQGSAVLWTSMSETPLQQSKVSLSSHPATKGTESFSSNTW